MSSELFLLLLSAITISFLHTLSGPDHYLPFIALAKARRWSFGRTLFWTMVCGCGHVWSSVLLGLGGAAIGWSLSQISWLQSVRGGLAGWALLVFGLVYCVWGYWRAGRLHRHKHFDGDGSGNLYVYEHRHDEASPPAERHKVTPWVMFLIFLLGPCEPMIPLLAAPAARQSAEALVVLVLVYTFFTLATMVLMVSLGYYGVALFNTQKLERHLHTLGGATIGFCGAGMVLMGW